MKRTLIWITSILGGVAYCMWLAAVIISDESTLPEKLVILGCFLAIPAVVLGGIAWHLHDRGEPS